MDTIKFYSLEQVAELLGVNYQLVYKLVRSGELPTMRVGKVYRVLEADLQDYIQIGRTNLHDGVHPVVCSVCAKSYMSQQSVTHECVICSAPICRVCVELGKAKYCAAHHPSQQNSSQEKE